MPEEGGGRGRVLTIRGGLCASMVLNQRIYLRSHLRFKTLLLSCIWCISMITSSFKLPAHIPLFGLPVILAVHMTLYVLPVMRDRYPKPDQLLSLVAIAVETGRMTHPHPTGFLGAVASALFAAYAVQRRPITTWGFGLLNEACPIAWSFVQGRGYAVEESERDWSYFSDKWTW